MSNTHINFAVDTLASVASFEITLPAFELVLPRADEIRLCS